jgi:hypothetical protein
MNEIKYEVIPSLQEFHLSEAKSRLLVGPFRSGKSVAAVMELFMMAWKLKDCRTVCVRSSYRELKDTVVRSFFEWVPKEKGEWRESDMIFKIPTPLGGHWEIFFRSAETADDVSKFKGFEITTYWLDEAHELSPDVKSILDGRLSWPAGSDSKIFRSILTTNPCSTNHWVYNMYVRDPLPGHVYWRQGANENPHLHKEYYDDLRQQYRDRPELMRRYVEGQWGEVFSGLPVYGQSFMWDHHVSREHLTPVKDRPIYRGWDYGVSRNPAVVFAQVLPSGQLIVLREMWSDDTFIDEFGDAVNSYSRRNFPDFVFEDVGDPAGRARVATNESSAQEILATKGIYVRSAYTNELTPRLESVQRLLALSPKGRPKILFDPRCTRLIDGMSGGYKYKERHGTQEFSEIPDKNKFSHICEALQYLCMDVFGYADHNPRLWNTPLKYEGVVGA